MDFFTHLLLGFIIALIVDGPNFDLNLVAAIFMGQISDLDFMLFPLWKKLPFTGHHGITHTPIFVLSVSLLISIIFYLLGIFAFYFFRVFKANNNSQDQGGEVNN